MISSFLHVSRWLVVGGPVVALVVASGACTVTTTRVIVIDGGPVEGDGAASSSGASSSGTSGIGTSSGTSGASSGTSGASSGTSGASSGTSGASKDATVGGICDPPATVTYTKVWQAPHPHQAACSQANIDLFRKVCLGTQADGGAACKAFTGTAAGKTCEDCILPSTGTLLGPLVATGGFVSPNIAGCIALQQGTQADGAGCAGASLYLTECHAAACGACAKDVNTTTDDINACDTAADTGACVAEATAATCVDQLADAGGAGAACLAGTDFDSNYTAIVPTFCLQ
jgi:hypothetical protein